MLKKKINLNEPATKKDLIELEAKLSGEIGSVKGDVAVLKTDVAVLKTDVSVLKGDVSILKGTVNAIQDQMTTNFEKVFSEFDKMKEDRIFAIAKDRELEKRIEVLEASRA